MNYQLICYVKFQKCVDKFYLHVSLPRNFCNIPAYIDGMVMYEYIAILCNFKWSPPVQWGSGSLAGPPNQYT